MSDQISEQTEAGKTSVESRRTRQKIDRPGLWEGFNIYTAALLLSAVFVATSIVMLFLELRDWGSFPGTPWNTDAAQVESRGG
jgi:hypothetical protein